MNLFKEVIKNNFKMISIYVLIGIIINFLNLYEVTYYQKILDAFQYKTLKINLLIIYGLLVFINNKRIQKDIRNNYENVSIVNNSLMEYLSSFEITPFLIEHLFSDLYWLTFLVAKSTMWILSSSS